MSKQLQRPSEFSDEKFVAQLGIISIQTRIDEDSPLNRRWTTQFTIGETHYHIEGYAADFGRPRGIDTDILLSLETLFICQGCPDDNKVVTTGYELISMVYKDKSGKVYQRLRESLQRLSRVGFKLRTGVMKQGTTWGRFAHTTLALIDSVQYITSGDVNDADELQVIDAQGQLVIKFSEPMAASIRAGYTQHLNRRLLTQLEQPVARALYRILQAHRPESGELTCNLLEWGSVCGIIATDPRKIRRTLETAHDDLVANTYLEGVEYDGRGSTQTVTYHYRAVGSPDPELVQLLIDVNIPKKRAEELAAEAPERIEAAVAYVRNRKQIRNPAGMVIDILVQPEKYALPAAPQAAGGEAPAAAKLDYTQIEAEAQAAFAAKQAMLLEADGETQWREVGKTLKLLCKGELTAQQFAEFEAACRSGQLSAAQVTQDLGKILAKAERRAFLMGLLERTDG